MAVPKDVPEAALALAYAVGTNRTETAGDLTIIAFCSLLRSGEYTKPRKVKRNGKMVCVTRTVQFKVKDVGFWKDGKILPRRSSLSDLLQADAAMIGAHSLRAGGTMALKIMGEPDSTISIIWPLDIQHMDDVHPQPNFSIVQGGGSKDEHTN